MKENNKGRTQKKVIWTMLSALIVLGAIATGVLVQRFKKIEILEEINKAGIEWYKESGDTFTISTVDELYDLAFLSDFYDFKGQTFKLGADLVINEGNAADWEQTPPERQWFPIQGFAGTFDGQGHTISGVYGYGSSTAMGLFSDTHSKCKIKDFKLVNSYFYGNGLKGVGSISSNGSGRFEKIYSDAIVVGENAYYVGGFIGRVDSGRENAIISRTSQITDCWFDGTVRMTNYRSRQAGGFIGSVSTGAMKVEHCLSSGEIILPTKAESYHVGGFCGAVGDNKKTGAQATLYINDSLHVGKINSPTTNTVGSIVGHVLAKAAMTVEGSYSIKNEFNAIELVSGGTKGTILTMKEKFFIGQEAYRWTTLDFKNHWSAIQDQTPELTCFTTQNPMSLEGVAKGYNIDWYRDDISEFELNTLEELYGLQMLCNQKITFAGKTIKLGADIVMNEGKATDWAQGKNLPQLEWIPIGGGGNKFIPFSGTFDGQGHTISGLYMMSDDTYMGLFGTLDHEGNATIKNLRLVNSYLECTNETAFQSQVEGLGSIAGQGAGLIDTVYSDAIVVSKRNNVGGLIGNHRQPKSPLTVRNSWFDGEVTGAQLIGGIVGYVHGDIDVCKMEDCLVTANLTSTLKEGKSYIGGLAGRMTSGDITSCVVSGKLTGADDVRGFIGVVGSQKHQTFKIQKCYNATNAKEMFMGGLGQQLSLMLKNVSIDEIKGTNGYVNTLLKFYGTNKNNDGRWVAVKDKVPQLKSFTNTKTANLKGLTRNVIDVDISWYNESKKTYTIKTKEQLYGLAELCNSKINFEGKTIKLANDIQINEGKATDWAKGVVPAYNWTPIGGGVTSMDYIPFSGTFDGQGHTISGLYMKSAGQYLGLFGVTDANGSAIIKNLKVTNSYYETTRTENHVGQIDGTGAIVGRGSGTLDTVYSDAIIVSKFQNTGGLVGTHRTGPLDMTNCWFNGNVTGTIMIGGLVGFSHGEVSHMNLTDCLVTADLTSTLESGNAYVGGLSGRLTCGKINSCVVKGTLTGDQSVQSLFGVLASRKDQNIEIGKCYNATNIEKYFYGGLGKTTTSNLRTLSEEMLIGTQGYVNTLLSFYDKNTNTSGRWVVATSKTPELKSFSAEGYLSDLSALSSYIRTAEVDTSWYDASKSEFTINTLNELYGLASLCNARNTFAGKTIKLGADIIMNNGKASDWANGEVPVNEWIPIGGGSTSMDYIPFSGTFDGQGHTISGVYLKSSGQYLGLFGVTDANGSATIKNLKVTNSYYETTRTENHVGQIDGTGSIVGRGTGTFENIYSDAIVYSRFQNTGGLIGTHRTGLLDMTNCWFDGKVTGTILVGGLLGYAHGEVSHTNMTDCLVTAEIASTNTSGDAYVGGLSGRLTCGKIDSCIVQGTLTGPGAVRGFFGLFGSNKNQTIELSKLYHAANATSWYAGGLGTTKTSNLKNISEDNLKGTKAYGNTLLSFYDKNTNVTGRWVLIEGATPELKSFTDKQYKKDLSELSSMARPAMPDTSWYDASKTTFTISCANELYGLATLCNAGNTFAGKTIKLGADITLNNGNSSDWANGEVPTNIWIPIGGGASSMDYIPFSGTFDGQGHTISGVYFKSSGQFLGLFGVTDANGSATIKNLKVTNSYYESTKTTEHSGQIDGIGGIIGRGTGTLDTIYCDAIIVSKTQSVGGMIGVHRSGPLDMTNCWFAGKATGRRIIGGMVGFGHGEVTYTNMTDCLVTADLTSIMTSGDAYIGGIAGYMTNGKIDSWIIKGTFTGPAAVLGFFGGFGLNKNQTIELSKLYNTTSTTSWYAGGLGTLKTSELKNISEDNLKGTKGYTNTLLSFYDKNTNATGRWVLIEGATPELKSFTDKQYKKDLSELSSMARPALSDTSWYDANKTTFTISTADELYGLATLCNAGNTFAGKTIKLGADITLNNGKASDWAKGEVPTNIWIPIGGGASSMDYIPFSGTFDGQGHTISGVYFKSAGQFLGLFGVTDANGSATIKNLKVTNSYYESTKTTEHSGQIDGIGGIIGRGTGTLDTIYCDAIIVSKTQSVGGMIGVHRSGPLDMTNCWFAGKATGRRIIGGMVGFGHGEVTYTNMTDCLVTADLTSIMTSGDAYIGGIAGYMTNGKIDSCIVQGTFTGPAAVRGFFGGFGSNKNQTIELTKLYNTTSTTSWYAGGLGTLKTSELKNISEDNLKGTKGYTNTLLSFYDKNTNPTGRWVLIEDGTPELKSFTTKEYSKDLSSIITLARPINTTWYDASKNEFTLKTMDELYGLATLCNAGNTFAGKTIKLGADIKLNSGKASDWAKGEVPTNIWIPIGGGASSMDYIPFSGTFDGQGHTISGVYFKSSGQFLGLFGVTDANGSATIKNLKVTNSYYESTKTTEHSGQIDGIGGIIGRGTGTLDTIYCDAIIVSKTQSVGGMIGVHRSGPLDMTNCWFAGKATGRRIIGGMVGFGHGEVTYTNMTDCLVTADLTSIMTSGDAYIGGIAGYMTNGKIDSCIVQGTFTGPAAVRGFFGGFGSDKNQTIELSKLYNTTSTTSWYAGGLGTLKTSELKNISEDNLKGTKGYTNTLLSFYDKNTNPTGRWVLIEDGTPELKSFTTKEYSKDLSSIITLARPINTTWYDASKNEFTLKTMDELYGLATLCNAGNTFAGKTIKLGADIKLNSGKASDWAKGEVPTNIWIPIGGGASSMDYIPFSGTFDGQGHTISGVYFKSAGQFLGLFGVTDANGSATIKNLKVTNSYYESTKTTEHSGQIDGIGGIIGRGTGTLDTIYCDAIIVSKTQSVGGMIGVHRSGPLDMTNCWFAGKATGRRIIGGMVGFGHGEVTYTNMTDCLVTADLTSIMTSGDAYIGGIAGYMTNGKIDSCIIKGTFTGPAAVRAFIGGLGSNVNQTIELSKLYHAANATSWYAGGLGTTITSNLKNISEDNLKGTKGYTNTLLAFYDKNTNTTGRWVVIEDGTPELKSFTKKTYMDDLSGLSR